MGPPRRDAAALAACLLALAGIALGACVGRENCSDHGDCVNGVCRCERRYDGAACENTKSHDYTDIDTMLQTSALLALIYVLSAVFRHMRAELLGGIMAGFLMGPVAGWTAHTDAVYTVGRIGLSLLVMEGGLGIDVSRFLQTWRLTTNLALTGTILPCLLGWALLTAFGYGSLEGFAAGTALSSTSIGMSLMMLIQFGYLKTPLGGIIAVAAMVDDVASLVILAVLGELQAADSATGMAGWVWLVARPVLISLAVIAAGAALTAVVPAVYARIEAALRRRARRRVAAAALKRGSYPADGVVGSSDAATEVQQVEERVQSELDHWVVVGLMVSTFVMVIGAGYAGSSYLLGAFSAGMAFSQLRAHDDVDVLRAEVLWQRHSPLAWWLVSVSFATLGLSIPAADLFEAKGFGLGLLFVIPTVLGKLCLGSFVPGADGSCWSGGFCGNPDDALVLGWAMVARGELGFVMAQQAFEDDILSARTYVACVWALFFCTLVPPFIFGRSLARKKARDDAERAAKGGGGDGDDDTDDDDGGGKRRGGGAGSLPGRADPNSDSALRIAHSGRIVESPLTFINTSRV